MLEISGEKKSCDNTSMISKSDISALRSGVFRVSIPSGSVQALMDIESCL